MNSLFKLSSFFLAGLLFVYSCTEDNSTNPPDEENLSIYFPNSEGTFYKYEIIQTDSNNVISTGIRNVIYLQDSLINGTRFKLQIDSIQTDLQSSVSSSYFRTTQTGVFYFVDTTGFTNFLPDSLKSSVELQNEMREFLFPLSTGSFWTVYRISIELNELLRINLVDITGKYIADETLILNLPDNTKSVSTKKVKYDFKLQTGTEDSAVTFNANSWIVEDIGIVKMEGSAVVISLFSGGGLNLSDTSLTVTQNLIDYDVK